VDIGSAFILSPAQEALGILIVIRPHLPGMSGSVRVVHGVFARDLAAPIACYTDLNRWSNRELLALAIKITPTLDNRLDLVKFYTNEIWS
jgi:hypothetical protein